MSTTTATATQFVTSADGTPIAYEVHGRGPALVVVDGALCRRAMGPARGLAAALADHFTVHLYDRRDRGESGPGDTAWSVQREIEDLRAVVDATGGPAHLLGSSSGAVLALDAVQAGVPVDRLVVYEAPFLVDASQPPNDPRLPERTQALVEQGRRAEAVKLFLRTVGMPAPMIAVLRFLPPWKSMLALAHTLPHDLAVIVGLQQGQPLPAGCYAGVGVETLVLAGGKSPVGMQNAQAAIAAAVPRARLQTLPGQTHLIKPKVVAAAVTPFLLAGDADPREC